MGFFTECLQVYIFLQSHYPLDLGFILIQYDLTSITPAKKPIP